MGVGPEPLLRGKWPWSLWPFPTPCRAPGVGGLLPGCLPACPAGAVRERTGGEWFPYLPRGTCFWLGKGILNTFGVEGCVGVVPINYQTPSLWLQVGVRPHEPYLSQFPSWTAGAASSSLLLTPLPSCSLLGLHCCPIPFCLGGADRDSCSRTLPVGILCASEHPLSLEALPVGGGQEALARTRQKEAFYVRRGKGCFNSYHAATRASGQGPSGPHPWPGDRVPL